MLLLDNFSSITQSLVLQKIFAEMNRRGITISKIPGTNIIRAKYKKKMHIFIHDYTSLIPYNIGILLTSPFYVHEILTHNGIKCRPIVENDISIELRFARNTDLNEYNVCITNDGFFNCIESDVVHQSYISIAKKALQVFAPAPYITFTIYCKDISKEDPRASIAYLSMSFDESIPPSIAVNMLFPETTNRRV